VAGRRHRPRSGGGSLLRRVVRRARARGARLGAPGGAHRPQRAGVGGSRAGGVAGGTLLRRCHSSAGVGRRWRGCVALRRQRLPRVARERGRSSGGGRALDAGCGGERRELGAAARRAGRRARRTRAAGRAGRTVGAPLAGRALGPRHLGGGRSHCRRWRAAALWRHGLRRRLARNRCTGASQRSVGVAAVCGPRHGGRWGKLGVVGGARRRGLARGVRHPGRRLA
jgi:hypothetical protein